MNHVLDGVRILWGKGNIWGISQPIVKYMEYPECVRHSQSYSLGAFGRSDAAFRCQWCTNLLVITQKIYVDFDENVERNLKNSLSCARKRLKA